MHKPTDTKKVVIPFIGKGIGDAIVFSGLIDILTKNDYKVSIIVDRKIHFLFKNWKSIDNLLIYTPESETDTIKSLKQIGLFIFIDPHEITHSSIHTFNIIRKSKPFRTIGFNVKHSIYDDIVCMTQASGHISGKCIDLLNFLDIRITEYNYVIDIPEDNKIEAFDFIEKLENKKIISFIPYGSVSARFFSMAQIESILSYFSDYNDELHIVIIGEQDKIKEIEAKGNSSKNPYTSFFTAAQLIKESHLVITPDTSFTHLSRAFNKRMVCFYPFKFLNESMNNSIVWGPNYDNAVQINLSEDRLEDVDVHVVIEHIRSEMERVVNLTH